MWCQEGLKEHNGNLGIEKTKNPYLLFTPPPPPTLLSLLIGYIKFLFPKQFDTIFNLDQYPCFKLGVFFYHVSQLWVLPKFFFCFVFCDGFVNHRQVQNQNYVCLLRKYFSNFFCMYNYYATPYSCHEFHSHQNFSKQKFQFTSQFCSMKFCTHTNNLCSSNECVF